MGIFPYWEGGILWNWPSNDPKPSSAPAPAPDIPNVTGIDPNELPNVTYGKRIPIFAGGKARFGTAGIVFGPYVENGLASFATSFGFPANVGGLRRLYEIAFDSRVAWIDPDGIDGPTTPVSGFISEAFAFRFYRGTLAQTFDALETQKFPGEEIAYRPQMVIFFENLPVAQFGNKIPYVAAVIGDITGGADPDDGINLGTAIERIAESPWVGYTSAEFDTTGITDVVGAAIVSETTSFLDFLKNIARVYRTYNILQTDKLEVVDRGNSLTADITFTRDHIIGDITYSRDEPESVPREHELVTIDKDADYTMVPSKAEHPRDPVAVSASVGKETITLPLVTDASTRMSLVTYMHYAEESARKKVALMVTPFGLELEPGDIFALSSISDGIEDEDFKVLQTSHNGNWTVNVTGEALLKCTLPVFSPGGGGPPLPAGPSAAWSASRNLIEGWADDWYSLTSGAVDTLFDQTGNGRILTQAAAGRRPTLVESGPNNRIGMDFNPAATTQLQSAVPLSEFIEDDDGYLIISFIADAFTLSNGTPSLNDMLLGDSGLFLGMNLKNSGGVPGIAQCYNWDGNYDVTSHTGLTVSVPYVLEMWRAFDADLGSLVIRSRINMSTPVAQATSGFTTTMTGALMMGARASASGFNGRIFEALAYQQTPDSAVRDAIAANMMSWVGAS